MRTTLILFTLLFLGWGLQAQDANNQSRYADSTRHHGRYDQWQHMGKRDSLAYRNNSRYGRGRDFGQAWNHQSQHGFRKGHHGFRNHRGGFYARAPIHYTPEQKKQLQAINDSYRKKSSDLYKNDNLTLREYKAQLITLQKDRKSQVSGLLTAEQKTQLADWKKRADENAQVRAAAHLERLKITLNLNDQQTATLKSQQQNFRSQLVAIRENDNLLPYQKKEQMKDLATKQKDVLKTVLTSEQLSQWENMHKQRFSRS
jgi:hypothetical protein